MRQRCGEVENSDFDQPDFIVVERMRQRWQSSTHGTDREKILPAKRYSLPLSPHDDFPKMVPREEKLHGIEVLEQFLETPIVEELRRPPCAAGRQFNGPVIDDPIGVGLDASGSLLGVEQRKQASSGFHHLVESPDHGRNQLRRHELERVPDQRAVESNIFEIKRDVQESGNLQRIVLIFVKVPVGEAQVQLSKKIIGVNPVAIVRDEADRGLVGSGEIQNGEPWTLLQGRAKLI
jgi:hypothetical protein